MKDADKLNALRERFPSRQDILYVFGGVVFLIYSWAMRGFFYQFPSLRLYHTLGEIFAVFSYLMAFALLESLIIMSLLLLLGVVLPEKWFREGFVYKGFIAVLVAGIGMIRLNQYLFSLSHAMPPMNVIYLGTSVAFLLLFYFIWLFQRVPRLQNYLLSFQERLQIFMYFYIPLGLIGIVVVVVRNLR